MSGAIKASAADFIAQKSPTSAKPGQTTKIFLNYKRNFALLLYGGVYQGVIQEYLFNGIYPCLFGTDNAIVTAAKKVLFDMFVTTPILCLPVAYIIKALIFRQTFMEGIRRYVNDVKTNNLLTKCWLVWGPVQSITFTVIPTQFRISFCAFFSFFWLILLSRIASEGE